MLKYFRDEMPCMFGVEGRKINMAKMLTTRGGREGGRGEKKC